ncbi:adenylate kinase isoenzyme 1-like isoform X1 [Terrapene carolina triunguis]|uniref:adenylate kinase isoenzyme 1-like isoform X1 n=1 Tax=Terrapene triunguis TaxID=2587831 RepID=UPI000E77D790|nr:adenylate kinase isoenzyme 1-like isoform X1 [Terrapene carolina triunguis]
MARLVLHGRLRAAGQASTLRGPPGEGSAAGERSVPWKMGLCQARLPKTAKPLNPELQEMLKSQVIIFVIGGPGSGKGTQCERLAAKYQFQHLGMGNLLRAEASEPTRQGRQIKDIMLKGALVPSGFVLDLLNENLLQREEAKGFLVNGFPRELNQAKDFERVVSALGGGRPSSPWPEQGVGCVDTQEVDVACGRQHEAFRGAEHMLEMQPLLPPSLTQTQEGSVMGWHWPGSPLLQGLCPHPILSPCTGTSWCPFLSSPLRCLAREQPARVVLPP